MEVYKYEPHAAQKMKTLPYFYCRKCGLVYLKNSFTQWSIDKGCNNEDHPDYKRRRESASKF